MLVLLVLDGAAVIATYSRFPESELYHVHLVAVAVVGLIWPRLEGRPLRIAGVAAIALCAAVYFAVDEADLDAKALNAVPALGVALAFVLALGVGVPSVPRLVRGDKLRIGVAPVLVFF